MIVWHLLVSSLSEGAGKCCTDSTDPGVGAGPGDPRLSQLCSAPGQELLWVSVSRDSLPVPLGFILLVFAHTFTCLSY